jgi:adenylate cyclase
VDKSPAPGSRILVVLLVLVLLAGLPVAVWLDLSNLTENTLRRQSSDLNSLVSSVRAYYVSNVVGRVLASKRATTVVHNYHDIYHDIPGAIPIPDTLSIELGQVINRQQHNIGYRFVSDFPFEDRAPHKLDAFEADALKRLRADRKEKMLERVSASMRHDNVRLVVPVIMGQACVNCHDTHPDSPKRDWKVGDARGIQEVSISEPVAKNIFSFKYLLGYFFFMAGCGATFIGVQRRQAATIRGMNKELETANEFLAGLSTKISRYLSPQICKSNFSGQKDVIIHTERKKLTIFFSDIKDFTTLTERLQPEQITALLNEYLTDMSKIALFHGGTIDKFVSDAMLIFFGDPETKGEAEDAKACLKMAADMQQRLAQLNMKWRNDGIEGPFRVRMGINTGYCNVGNFGSADRMDYTINGAEANLAARLQSIAEPGHIVLNYETCALVRDSMVAHALRPINMKGISREVIPYAVEGMLDAAGNTVEVFSEHMTGLDFYLDSAMVTVGSAERIRAVLQKALSALDRAGAKPAGPPPGRTK